MSRKYKIRDQQKLYFVTFTVLDWMDVFIRDEYRSIIVESLKFCQVNKGLEVYAYCIMTSHVHLILRSSDETKPLEGIIRDIKGFTSRSIRKVLENSSQVHESRQWMLDRMYRAGKYNTNNIDFQFWQQHNHPIELNSNELMDEKLEYIHLNPVAAGFVDIPEAWLYSSARDYAGVAKGMIDLVFIG